MFWLMFQTLKFLKKSGPLISEAIRDSYSRCLVAGLLSPRLVDVQPSSLSQVGVCWGIQGEIYPSSLKAVEATRPWFLIANCSEKQFWHAVSRSNNVLLTLSSPERFVFSVSKFHARVCMWKRSVSAGHVHQKGALPGNSLHILFMPPMSQSLGCWAVGCPNGASSSDVHCCKHQLAALDVISFQGSANQL